MKKMKTYNNIIVKINLVIIKINKMMIIIVKNNMKINQKIKNMNIKILKFRVIFILKEIQKRNLKEYNNKNTIQIKMIVIIALIVVLF